MQTFNNLPLFTMAVDGSIETEDGVSFVALVERPAIRLPFLAFNDQEPLKFTVTSEDRRIVSGPLMLADTPIFRQPPEVPAPCYVSFPPAAIETIVRKFFAQGNQANVNLSHDPAQVVEGVVMFESWISDPARGIAPLAGYEDTPAGSWFGSFMVDNETVWADIKAGTFKGFSVEAQAWALPAGAMMWWQGPEVPPEDREFLDALAEALKIPEG